MGAAVAFADLGDFRATTFPSVSRVEDDQFYFEPEISPEHCLAGCGKTAFCFPFFICREVEGSGFRCFGCLGI